MLHYTKIGLLALTFASAPAFAQDRGPGSPSAPNAAAQESTAREAAMRNCEKLSGAEKDSCMRDFQAKTGSRTEPSSPTEQSSAPSSGSGTGSSDTSSGSASGTVSGPSSGSSAQTEGSSSSTTRTQ